MDCRYPGKFSGNPTRTRAGSGLMVRRATTSDEVRAFRAGIRKNAFYSTTIHCTRTLRCGGTPRRWWRVCGDIARARTSHGSIRPVMRAAFQIPDLGRPVHLPPRLARILHQAAQRATEHRLISHAINPFFAPGPGHKPRWPRPRRSLSSVIIAALGAICGLGAVVS